MSAEDTEPDWLNCIGRLDVRWMPQQDMTVFHFVDATGPSVTGYVRDLLAWLKEYPRDGYRVSVDIDMDGYRWQLENAKSLIFCNHSNRPDHILVELTDQDLDLTTNDDAGEIVFHLKGWMDLI